MASTQINYGAIGVTIGHEISHGVDDQGAQYDAKGALTNWWTPENYTKFKEKTACTATQYDALLCRARSPLERKVCAR